LIPKLTNLTWLLAKIWWVVLSIRKMLTLPCAAHPLAKLSGAC